MGRNDEWSVLNALSDAFAYRDYPWRSLIDSILHCSASISLAKTFTHTREDCIKRDIESLKTAFTRQLDLIDDAAKLKAMTIFSRNYAFKEITDLLRYSLPGGESLVITDERFPTYRVVLGVVEEGHYRVNVLPTLTRITIEHRRWRAWRTNNDLLSNGSVALEAEALHKACRKLKASALTEEEKGDNIHLYFDNVDQAVWVKLAV